MSAIKEHIDTKKLVPQLRFKEFDWEWKRTTLGNLFSFKNGLNSDKDKYGSGIKFINVLDIIGNEVITYDSIIGKVEVTEKELEKNEVIYGDVLFQRSSETREEVGQANVYVDEKKSAVFGGFVIRGRKKEDYNPYFMNYLLKTSAARKEITTKSGGSTRYNVGQESLSEVFVNLTHLPEQRKIASFLSAVDVKIQQLTKKKALLEQYKKGVMQQLFSGQLRFKDQNGNPYPDWEEKRLGEICNNIAYGMNAAATAYDGENKYLRITDIDESSNRLSSDKLTSPDGLLEDKFKVKEGDILFARTGASVGKSYLYSTIDGVLYFAGFLIRFHVQEGDPTFIYLQSQTSRYDKWVKVMSMRSGQPGINAEEYKSFKIDFPCLQEQQKIATYLSSIDTKIEAVNNQITQTQTFKKGLLQQLFV